jgi:hypothetical protein
MNWPKYKRITESQQKLPTKCLEVENKVKTDTEIVGLVLSINLNRGGKKRSQPK